jgi:hypothetical protein
MRGSFIVFAAVEAGQEKSVPAEWLGVGEELSAPRDESRGTISRFAQAADGLDISA